MPDLLIELLSEEIPARMQAKAAEDLRRLMTDGLVEAGLTYEGVREYWTPRRLTLPPTSPGWTRTSPPACAPLPDRSPADSSLPLVGGPVPVPTSAPAT